MAQRLKDRAALITGSDSGIGQAMAEEFAREGADVCITYYHDRDGAQETRRRVEAQGRKAHVVQCDQQDPAQVARAYQEAEQALGPLFILVNNAGIDSIGQQVAEMADAAWDREIKTNLYGPFYFCRQFINSRRQQGGGGKIINVTSVHEDIPRIGSAGYDASKGGLRNLTYTLCLELAPDHINVNNIAPGMVLTPMNQAAIENREIYDKQVASIPWRRAGEPWEVARLGVYLASDDADYVTGQTFTIDGGLTQATGQGA